MADYTISVWEIVQAIAGSLSDPLLSDVDAAMAKAAPQIFGDAPYFNPEEKEAFQIRFIKNFLFREICTTPYAKWVLLLRARLAEIMPYYTEIWKTAQWDYDPLETIRLDLNGDKNIGERTDLEHNQTSGYNVDHTSKNVFDETSTEDITTDGEHHDTGSGTEDVTTTGKFNTDTTSNSTVDYTRDSDSTHGETSSGTNSGSHSDEGSTHTTENGTTSNIKRFSDTPQGDIPVEYDSAGHISKQYLTNVTVDNGSTTGKSDTTNSSSGSTSGSTSGKMNSTDTTDITDKTVTKSTGNENGTTEGTSDTDTTTKTDGTTHGTSDLDATRKNTTDFTENTGQSAHENHTTGTDFTHGDDWREHRQGHTESASYQNLVQQSRDLIVEYDRLIYQECADLFFQLY